MASLYNQLVLLFCSSICADEYYVLCKAREDVLYTRAVMSSVTHTVLALLGVVLLKSSVDEAAVYVSFPRPSSDAEVTEFHHLAVDPVTGSVFVGARNRLHQLDGELTPVTTVETGPRPDNRLCTESFGAPRCGAGGTTVYDARPTDNINKVKSKVKFGYIIVRSKAQLRA